MDENGHDVIKTCFFRNLNGTYSAEQMLNKDSRLNFKGMSNNLRLTFDGVSGKLLSAEVIGGE